MTSAVPIHDAKHNPNVILNAVKDLTPVKDSSAMPQNDKWRHPGHSEGSYSDERFFGDASGWQVLCQYMMLNKTRMPS